MSRFNRRMDLEILRTVMPDDYARHRRRVLCNDCEKESVRFFHVIGHKCSHCGGYNTRIIAGASLVAGTGSLGWLCTRRV